MLGTQIVHYTDADYCALANSLLLQTSGSGDIKIDKVYTASDIYEQILQMIGMGISEAYPFLMTTQYSWEEYVELMIILGLVSSRAKATTITGEINLHSSRNALRAPENFDRYTHANMDNFGR